jgi:hypothetical protein
LRRALGAPPGETTHWAIRAMAKVTGARLTRRRLRRGVFHSLVDLQAAINHYFAEHNTRPKPFVWTANPDAIITAAKRGYQVSDSIH